MITHFGLDIGAGLVKVVQIENEGNSYRLNKAGIADNPNGSGQFDSELEKINLAETIKKLVADLKITTKEVAIALPESDIYTQLIELPHMSEEQLEQAVVWEAENTIPRPLAEVNFSWKVVSDPADKKSNIKILLVASPVKIVEKFSNLIKICGLELRLMETEAVSIGRILKFTHPQSDSLVVLQIGKETSDIAVFRHGELCLSRSLPTAGNALTRGVSASLGLDEKASEQYKKAYGLSNQLEGKIATSIMPVLESLSVEVKKVIHNFEQKESATIRLMILSGGSVLMPGLVEYFSKKLGIETQLGDPTPIVKIDENVRLLMKKNAPLFLVSFGLAVAEI